MIKLETAFLVFSTFLKALLTVVKESENSIRYDE